MNTSEKKTEKKLRLGIERLGGLCLKFPATFFAGIPDRLCILPGALVFFVETKGEGLRLSKRQLYVAKLLERLGVKVYVANSEALVDELLRACAAVYEPKPAPLTKAQKAELDELTKAQEAIKGHYGPEEDLNDVDLLRLKELQGEAVVRLTREGFTAKRGNTSILVTYAVEADPLKDEANRNAAREEALRLSKLI